MTARKRERGDQVMGGGQVKVKILKFEGSWIGISIVSLISFQVSKHYKECGIAAWRAALGENELSRLPLFLLSRQFHAPSNMSISQY